MAFCQHCGAQNQGGTFCGQCGRPIQAAQQPAAAQQQPYYQAPPRRSSTGIWVGLGAALVVAAAAFVYLSGGGGGTTPGGGGSQQESVASPWGFDYTTYGLAVPGAAYTEAAGDGKTRYVLSSGTKTKSTIRLNADGTYEWDSAWDGKVYKGTYEKTGDAGYPIRIRNAQEGKDWGIGPDTNKGAKPGTILVWNGSIWYVGYPLK